MKKDACVTLLILALCINHALAATYSGVEPIGEYTINELSGVLTSDLDKDGLKEVVAYTRSMVYVFNSSASLKWTYEVNNLRAVYVSDIDNDHREEIIVASGETVNNMEWGDFLILDMNGKTVHAYDRKSGESYPHLLLNSIATVDIDKNGYEEVVGSSSNAVHAIRDTYDKILWTTRLNDRINRLIVNRVDASNYEILVLADNALYSMDLNGTVKHVYNTSIGIRKMVILELGPSNERYMALVREDGQLMILDKEFTVRLDSSIIGNIVELSAYDINDDGLNEVVLGTNNGVYMLSNKYMITNRYVTNEPVSSIYFTDWEGDGVKELIFSSGEYLYALGKMGELEEKTGMGYVIKNLAVEEIEKNDNLEIIAYSDKKISMYGKKRETREESDARDAYLSAVGFLEMNKYDEAERSVQEALRIYTDVQDTSNINACKTLIDKISSERKKVRIDAAEKDYQDAERFLLAEDYQSASLSLVKASREFSALGDAQGIAKCGELSDRIVAATTPQKKDRENIQDIMDSAKNINIFPIMSVFLLIAIVLMLALLIGKKNEK